MFRSHFVALLLGAVLFSASPAKALPCWHGIADVCLPSPEEIIDACKAAQKRCPAAVGYSTQSAMAAISDPRIKHCVCVTAEDCPCIEPSVIASQFEDPQSRIYMIGLVGTEAGQTGGDQSAGSGSLEKIIEMTFSAEEIETLLRDRIEKNLNDASQAERGSTEIKVEVECAVKEKPECKAKIGFTF